MSYRVCRGCLLIYGGLRRRDGELCEKHGQSFSRVSSICRPGHEGLSVVSLSRPAETQCCSAVPVDRTPLIVDRTFQRGEVVLRAVRTSANRLT